MPFRRSRFDVPRLSSGWKICRFWPNSSWKRAIAAAASKSARCGATRSTCLHSTAGRANWMSCARRSPPPTRACTSHEITPGRSAAGRSSRVPGGGARSHASRSGSCSTSCWLRSKRKQSSARWPKRAATRPKRPTLLGMTRPRLYRRLVQLGLVSEGRRRPNRSQPEFIEHDATENDAMMPTSNLDCLRTNRAAGPPRCGSRLRRQDAIAAVAPRVSKCEVWPNLRRGIDEQHDIACVSSKSDRTIWPTCLSWLPTRTCRHPHARLRSHCCDYDRLASRRRDAHDLSPTCLCEAGAVGSRRLAAPIAVACCWQLAERHRRRHAARDTSSVAPTNLPTRLPNWAWAARCLGKTALTQR